jgi:hypothetical protein
MAATVHATIRLDVDLTNGLPVNEYKVIMGTLQEEPTPALVSERSLTGLLQVHRVMQGTEPLWFDNQRHELLLQGRSELNQLLNDLGRVVYFMPHLRDEADPESYTSVKLLKSVTGVKNLDPMLEWLTAAIELEDATSNTPS